MIIRSDNVPTEIFDKHYALQCPYCSSYSNISAISIPRFEYLARFQPPKIGIVYRCDSCNSPIFLRFEVEKYDLGNSRIFLGEKYEEIEKIQETFEFEYLPSLISDEFREALICYSNSCYNAF